MNFQTQYRSHERFVSNVGTPIKDVLSPVFDKEGRMSLEKVGEENLYDYIQSHRESVDIQCIIKRCAMGDTAALSRRQGMYGDFTQFPSTYAETLNAMRHAEEYFKSLDVETRAKFNHDFNQFIASMDNPEFAQMMGWAKAQDESAASSVPAPAAPALAPEGGVSE